MQITTTIIGAGVVGLAVAAELSNSRKGVLVIDRNPSFGQETSSRNSEVIHAGIYYAMGSKKARLCVEGNRLLYQICEAGRIPHRKCGKLIVATQPDEEDILASIEKRSRENGTEPLQPLSARQIRDLEPNVKASAALFSPATGIINSHRLMRHYLAKAQKNGAQFVPQTTVTRVEPMAKGGFRVHVRYPDKETDTFDSRWVINCAGLEADRVAASTGIDVDACGDVVNPKIVLAGERPANLLICRILLVGTTWVAVKGEIGFARVVDAQPVVLDVLHHIGTAKVARGTRIDLDVHNFAWGYLFPTMGAEDLFNNRFTHLFGPLY